MNGLVNAGVFKQIGCAIAKASHKACMTRTGAGFRQPSSTNATPSAQPMTSGLANAGALIPIGSAIAKVSHRAQLIGIISSSRQPCSTGATALAPPMTSVLANAEVLILTGCANAKAQKTVTAQLWMGGLFRGLRHIVVTTPAHSLANLTNGSVFAEDMKVDSPQCRRLIRQRVHRQANPRMRYASAKARHKGQLIALGFGTGIP